MGSLVHGGVNVAYEYYSGPEKNCQLLKSVQ